MDLSIIIVNWNSREFVRKCIASVLKWTRDIRYEIVVIDSASFDGCGEMLMKSFPEVRFLQSDRNVGFAAANNEAFRASRGRLVLFLNPDTELVSPAVNSMYDQVVRMPDAGVVGCRLLNSNGTIQASCVQTFPTLLNQFLDSDLLRRVRPASRLWGNAVLFRSVGLPERVEAISGACMMMQRTVFEQVGGFTEDYFMYAEDIDLCFKIGRAGYANYLVPHAAIVHHGGGSTENGPSDFSAVMQRESIRRFLEKTRGKRYGQAYRATTGVSSLCRVLILAVALPLARRGRGTASRYVTALRKWKAVLGWSFGRKAAMPDRSGQLIS
jgi:GT2 family glycosyltransferase